MAEQLKDQMIGWRRDFHRYPELSFHEFRTTQKVSEYLKSMGLEPVVGKGGIGVVADIEGAEPGPTVALRADMDALPIHEETGLEFASTRDGVMHACGHDGHISVLMACARILNEQKHQWRGRVRLLFQPAEELAPGGARRMIEQGFLDEVDFVYGLHLWSGLPSGVFRTVSGPMMAAADKFFIDIYGRGGHAGMPHEAVDALLTASHLIVNAQQIISRQVDPLHSGVVTFGKMESGSSFNVIADKARIQGTVRTLDESVRDHIREKLEQVIEHTCRMYGAEYHFDYHTGYPPVVNHPVEVLRLTEVANEVFGQEHVGTMSPIMAGEDFAYYLQKVPGAFCFVGAGGKGSPTAYPHHHPKFDIDESVLPQAAELMCRVALHHLEIQ
ncbi:MAG: amidohydrolase [Bacillaceae bacterium]|nr:amidohydrolase [Bacillaceae bacterium]